MGGFTSLQIPSGVTTAPQPLFDMSKAVPLTPQEHPLFDMSKAVPIVQPSAVPSGESADFWRGSPSIPGQAIQESLTMSPQKMKEGAVTAGKTAIAGAVAGSAALGAAGVLAPTVTTGTVGTGILDATGAEITKDVATMGPSLARAGANVVINAIKSHPIISTYVGTHLANALGIPLPKVLKAMAGIREVAE